MNSLSISWRELVAPAIIFVVIVALFGGLSTQAGWPSATQGWSLVVAIAAAVAFAPVVARALNFLQQSRASIEGPFGLKLNFASAVERSETKVGWLSVGTVQQGTLLPESGRGELEQAAIDAKKHPELVIDLEDGSAWYLTRLFAVAATAVLLGSPKLLVLVGQKGGQAKQAGGSIAPGTSSRPSHKGIQDMRSSGDTLRTTWNSCTLPRSPKVHLLAPLIQSSRNTPTYTQRSEMQCSCVSL